MERTLPGHDALVATSPKGNYEDRSGRLVTSLRLILRPGVWFIPRPGVWFVLLDFRFISCSFHCFTSCQRFETGVECITSRKFAVESINSTYERAVLRQLRTLMVSINVAPFKLVEKLCAFTAAFSVTRKAEDFNSKTCLACNIAPFYLVEKSVGLFRAAARVPSPQPAGDQKDCGALGRDFRLPSMNSVGKRIWSLRRRDYLATK
jgi:hypothetical protein